MMTAFNLYSAFLCSWADSLRSHVILHEWLAYFIARFFNIHLSGVLTALAWLMPHESAAVSMDIDNLIVSMTPVIQFISQCLVVVPCSGCSVAAMQLVCIDWYTQKQVCVDMRALIHPETGVRWYACIDTPRNRCTLIMIHPETGVHWYTQKQVCIVIDTPRNGGAVIAIHPDMGVHCHW